MRAPLASCSLTHRSGDSSSASTYSGSLYGLSGELLTRNRYFTVVPFVVVTLREDNERAPPDFDTSVEFAPPRSLGLHDDTPETPDRGAPFRRFRGNPPGRQLARSNSSRLAGRRGMAVDGRARGRGWRLGRHPSLGSAREKRGRG